MTFIIAVTDFFHNNRISYSRADTAVRLSPAVIPLAETVLLPRILIIITGPGDYSQDK